MAITGAAHAYGIRALAICAALAGCGRPDAPTTRAPAGAVRGAAPARGGVAAGPVARGAAPGAAAPAPGPRLPDGAVPIAYDLTLELDPERASFTGRVAITIAIAAPGTTRLWLHAAELDITAAALRGDRDEPVAVIDGGAGSQLRGFVLPHPVGPATVTLVIDYAGRVADPGGPTGRGTGGGEEGLFRERAGGRWYLYAQSESIFARKIVPCFDEPRFKSAWRVTAIVPRAQVALGNAPVAAARDLPGGRREVRFAEARALPSYLLAVAVGPFELVDAGRLGRGRVPVRIAVAAGDDRRAALARRELPRIIDALERYVDAPLPLAKLDVVAVPEFFGAMENPGLVTFAAAALTGPDFEDIAAHELAHQWFGDAVTPAWWEHLWLAEAFASWLGDKVAGALTAPRPPVLAHLARRQVLEADDEIDARALVHPIASPDEIEPAFDTIAYDKGAAVLAMFERFVGPDAWKAAVRRYLTAHAQSSVTSQAFLDALARETRPEIAGALADYLGRAGTPVVELALRCGAQPAVVASARSGVTVPVCVRFPDAATGTVRRCFLAGARTEQPLPASAGCPAWLVGNDGGLGYYRTVWRGAAPAAPLDALSPEEIFARGDDAAFAVRRGELPVPDALAELTRLSATRDPDGELAALEIAGAIDALVADPVRPAWTAWLAGRFADRLTRAALLSPRSMTDLAVRRAIVALAPDAIDPAAAAAARAWLERRAGPFRDPVVLRIAAAQGADRVFARLVRAAADAQTDEAQGEALEALGELPARFAPRIVGVLLERRFPADRVWPALAAMLSRGESRSAAWRAIHDRSGAVWAALPGAAVRGALAALAGLCDAGARAELAADAPHAAALGEGRRALERTLAAIDRCVARRAAAGDLAAALAAAPPAPSGRAGL